MPKPALRTGKHLQRNERFRRTFHRLDFLIMYQFYGNVKNSWYPYYYWNDLYIYGHVGTYPYDDVFTYLVRIIHRLRITPQQHYL